jgi:hypothetical protein
MSGLRIGLLRNRDFGFRKRQVIILFETVVLALGPTTPPVHWLTVVVSPGLNRPGRKATCSDVMNS